MPNAASFIGQVIDNGQCVRFTQLKATGGMPHTSQWKMGAKVRGNTGIAAGTVIASGWINGKYTSMPRGNHAAVYEGQNAQGIQVIDQWKGQRVHRRTLRWGGGSASNNGDAFYIVSR